MLHALVIEEAVGVTDLMWFGGGVSSDVYLHVGFPYVYAVTVPGDAQKAALAGITAKYGRIPGLPEVEYVGTLCKQDRIIYKIRLLERDSERGEAVATFLERAYDCPLSSWRSRISYIMGLIEDGCWDDRGLDPEYEEAPPPHVADALFILMSEIDAVDPNAGVVLDFHSGNIAFDEKGDVVLLDVFNVRANTGAYIEGLQEAAKRRQVRPNPVRLHEEWAIDYTRWLTTAPSQYADAA